MSFSRCQPWFDFQRLLKVGHFQIPDPQTVLMEVQRIIAPPGFGKSTQHFRLHESSVPPQLTKSNTVPEVFRARVVAGRMFGALVCNQALPFAGDLIGASKEDHVERI